MESYGIATYLHRRSKAVLEMVNPFLSLGRGET